MEQVAQLSMLLDRYHALCQYCDDLFQRTVQTYRSQIQCAKGCVECCLLETVVPLEASVIAAYLQSTPAIRGQLCLSDQQQDSYCVFLNNQVCLIYPVRPIICRTHGLPIRYSEHEGIDVCPLNFNNDDLTEIEEEFVLDADVITTNLLRLNLAFCLLTATAETAGERVSLQSLMTNLSKNSTMTSVIPLNS
ncbi:hypothetical protein U27_05424 [Candidatus Vecturithrix granuli]|uniref:YkgJ family cysteine cluster protein n=1 Tax=Vecturithrix granuli TaxID=1499967 RepID=A0A081C1J5_VECG1|nr:hypothetical protein U27_05424 [Candidatus Vecturithrix granuli]